MHWKRAHKGNDPNEPTYRDPREATIEGNLAKIPLGIRAKLGYAIVDKDFAWIAQYKWTLAKNGYATRDPHLKPNFMHHLIVGKAPEGQEVDHKNRSKLDNRKANLRFVTRSVNNTNASIRRDNKSGVRGVGQTSDGGWSARLKLNGNELRRTFRTFAEAVSQRKEWEAKYHVERY